MEFSGAAASIVISSHSRSDAMPTSAAVHDYIERAGEANLRPIPELGSWSGAMLEICHH